jgi:hypothetical protein
MLCSRFFLVSLMTDRAQLTAVICKCRPARAQLSSLIHGVAVGGTTLHSMFSTCECWAMVQLHLYKATTCKQAEASQAGDTGLSTTYQLKLYADRKHTAQQHKNSAQQSNTQHTAPSAPAR